MIQGFKGELIDAAHSSYDEARTIYNAMFDRHPALIAQCLDTQDVVAAVNYARENDLDVCVRCGGHSIPGKSMMNDAFIIDLTKMDSVEVDKDNMIVHFGGGCLLGTVDQATAEHGVCTPAGAVSHTGAGGLILGGGVGWMHRKYGLSVDNLLGVEVVLASGEVINANADENPDLYWAVRGGGGNFGVVTKFTSRLHERPDVLIGYMAIPIPNAAKVMRKWREIMPTAPDDLAWFSFFRWLPADVPGAPAEYIGKCMLTMPVVWCGDHEEGHRYLDALFKDLENETVMASKFVLPHVVLQSMIDNLATHGSNQYHKSGFVGELTNGLIDQLVEKGAQAKDPKAQLEIIVMGGAVARVAPEDTAFRHRNANWLINACAVWPTSQEDEPHIKWSKDTFDILRPHLVGSYSNFGGSEEDGETNPFGESWGRLREIKTKYDPHNFFHHNANILPL